MSKVCSNIRSFSQIIERAAVCLVAFFVFTATASAATFTVDTTADNAALSGCTDAAPGDCSLRGAINNAPVGATIAFSVTGVIEMGSPAIIIAKDLTINGPGASSLAVSGTGNGTGTISTASLFRVNSGIVGISGLMLRDGTGTGVSTINPATGTTVLAYFGGAVYMTGGALTLTSCILSNNRASAGGDGGGIYAGSGVSLTINSTTFSGNLAQDGGAIRMDGGSSLLMTDSTVSGNSANAGVGGGIYSLLNTTATVTNSTISGNSATAQFGGGGGFFNSGNLTITNSTISGNSTTATRTNSAIDGGGGIKNGGQLTIANSTITGNQAVNGGGIHSSLNGAALNLSNSIVAGNTGFTFAPDILGTVTAGDYNLVQNTQNTPGLTLPGTNNITGQPASLGPLANNGGATKTHALSFNSPALDKGNSTGTDQRGLSRPVNLPNSNYPDATDGNGADIGAFEAQTAPGGPTAASVSVSGRVMTESGRGIRNVLVRLVDGQGEVRTVLTSTFGYYRFADVPAGQTYTVSVSAKRYSFAQPAQVLSLLGETNDLDFVADN